LYDELLLTLTAHAAVLAPGEVTTDIS